MAPRRRAELAIAAVAFVAIAFAIYRPALGGPFFSDDLHYVQANPYLHALTLRNLIEIWNPGGALVGIVENYAPVHLTLHALDWQLFGNDVLGHHAVNVALHALAAWLLALLFARSGIPERVALVLAAIFLVHPAQVEAVAWIAQLKTPASMVLACAALLLHPRRPVLALVCFALALLAKPMAAVALPVAIVQGLTREPARPGAAVPSDGGLRWLAGWALVLAVFAVLELGAYFATAGRSAEAPQQLAVRIRGIVAVAMRYLAMAVTGGGLSLFHEPAPTLRWTDPWFVGGAAALSAALWRVVMLVRRRSRELVWWAWGAASFAPISGLIALPHALADRYLYFILPGLLGIGAFAAMDLGRSAWLRARVPAAARGARMRVAGGVLAVVAIAAFGARAHERAALWGTPARLLADAAQQYPHGRVALLRNARSAARRGDRSAAVDALEALVARGYDRLDQLLADPALQTLRGDPRFDALIDAMARELIARREAETAPAQPTFRVLAQAYWLLGETQRAEGLYLQALEAGGPADGAIREELAQLRRERRFEALRRRE